MITQDRSVWLRYIKAGLVAFSLVLILIPGIAWARENQLHLEIARQQEVTLTDTATPTASETVTATAGTQTTTPSSTSTITPTGASATVTWTPSLTTSPEISPTSSPDTETVQPTETATSTVILVITDTATLAPFPTVTFIYPDFSATPELLSQPNMPGNAALSKPASARINWIRLIVCVFVILLWIVLAAWFVYSQRREN